MGYSYGYNERGNLVLACDHCGEVGGVRKRTCPEKVTGDSLRTSGGRRPTFAYCYPPALCGECYKTLGGKNGVHGERCKQGAAKAQAEYDAIEEALDAGEMFVVAAYGDWHRDVAEGYVLVTFKGRDDEASVLMRKDEYNFAAKPKLSDYPNVVEV